MSYKHRLDNTAIYKFAVSSHYFFNDEYVRGPNPKLRPERFGKIHADTKKFLVSTSYDQSDSHEGLTGEAFIFNGKLIFSFGGTMGYTGVPVKDLYESARIYVGLETNQLSYALDFINQTKANIDSSRYDEVYTTGFSLGGAIAERCYYSGGVDKVIKFDSIDSISVKDAVSINSALGVIALMFTLYKTQHPVLAVGIIFMGAVYSAIDLLSSNEREPDNNIISIRAGFDNIITSSCHDDAGIKIRGENCNYDKVAQSILHPFFLSPHDDLVIGTCYIEYISDVL